MARKNERVGLTITVWPAEGVKWDDLPDVSTIPKFLDTAGSMTRCGIGIRQVQDGKYPVSTVNMGDTTFYFRGYVTDKLVMDTLENGAYVGVANYENKRITSPGFGGRTVPLYV